MKTLHIALLGFVLSTGLVPATYAHGPRVGLSINLGYPAYIAPPIYYPPRVVYAPPPPAYLPPPFVVAPYGYVGYGYYPRYDYDYGPRPGWQKHRRHRH